ncbi:MAG TPA: energy transducer TonB, partial [Thermoanaerobaculia bacterium]|nr:energy transducer TonB [Thermoanaerobaculia bacterium]
FARNQVIDVLNGIPFIAHDYAGGRSLRHIVDRARGGAGITPNPIPIEQAIVIAERVALSLDTISNMRSGQTKLTHGALIPQFVWITDDGEIRVSGQMLGPGLISSLKKDAKAGAELGRYFPPEYRESGEVQKTSAVYGAGAILYLVVTGQEPPDATSGSAFAQAIRASKTMTGTPIPDDILPIIEKALALDPAARYASIGELKQALSHLVHGGKYSASTFNLAFYMSNLLKKELEGEAIDRERESKVNVAAYVDAPAAASAPVEARSTPTFGVSEEPPSRSKARLAIAAVLILAAIGGGAFFMLRGKPAPAVTANLASAAAPAVPARPKIVSEPILATSTVATATTASVDPAAQKKAFEDAVNQKMQEEMMKLQDQYTRNLQKQQSKNAPVPTPPPTPVPAAVAAVAEERAPSAAQLDQTRQQQQPRVETPAPPPAAVAQSQPAPAVAVPAPIPQAPAIREGDVVDVSSLDTVPRIVRGAKPQYPVMAQRQRVETTVLLTVLITETGDVADVRVLR